MVLPAPDTPTSVVKRPAGISSQTSRSTGACAYVEADVFEADAVLERRRGRPPLDSTCALASSIVRCTDQ